MTIGNYHCRPPSPDCGAEEVNQSHSIVFTRRGLFVKHVRGQRVVADPNHVVFFNRGEPYRVSHPAGGDECTTFHVADSILVDVLSEKDSGVVDHPETPFGLTHGPTEPAAFLGHRKILDRAGSTMLDGLALDETVLGFVATVIRFAYRHRSEPLSATARRHSSRSSGLGGSN